MFTVIAVPHHSWQALDLPEVIFTGVHDLPDVATRDYDYRCASRML
jgi:hypothetical protein